MFTYYDRFWTPVFKWPIRIILFWLGSFQNGPSVCQVWVVAQCLLLDTSQNRNLATGSHQSVQSEMNEKTVSKPVIGQFQLLPCLSLVKKVRRLTLVKTGCPARWMSCYQNVKSTFTQFTIQTPSSWNITNVMNRKIKNHLNHFWINEQEN